MGKRCDRDGGHLPGRRMFWGAVFTAIGGPAAGLLAWWLLCVALVVGAGVAFGQAPLPGGLVLAQQAAAPVVEVAQAREVTAEDVLQGAQTLAGLMRNGGGTVAILGAAVLLLMQLLKWPRLNPLWERVPQEWRSFAPLVLGAVGGICEAVLAGTPWGIAVVQGLTGGGLALALYEQGRGLLYKRGRQSGLAEPMR
jgi:hypothetical protein